MMESLKRGDVHVEDMINRIVRELINQTSVWNYDGKNIVKKNALQENRKDPVTNEEILELPEYLRPQLTGSLAKVDIRGPSYLTLVSSYKKYLEEGNPKKKKMLYDHFRQGLDILDLDSVTYEMIGTNPNSMGHWLPQLAEAMKHQDFFKIPKTTIIKVPLPLLQLTRLDYAGLTKTTIEIVDRFCQNVFSLDENKDYFIKTGTYSSKFDFRNAHVHGAKEVWELGEYLLFIHHQACQMASPLNNVCIYGVSTTNEWVVREFITDKENNPCIYKGLPLHTEYRIFVDLDTKEVLGMNPYRDPEVMMKKFSNPESSDSPHQFHDYITYCAHEKILMNRYEENKERVKRHVKSLLADIDGLTGQWSIDIMQNKDDFWIIDMALAKDSALKHCVPKNLLKHSQENWIPIFSDKDCH